MRSARRPALACISALIAAPACAVASAATDADPAADPALLAALPTVYVIGAAPFGDDERDADTLPYQAQRADAGALIGPRAQNLGDALLREFDGVQVNDVQGNAFLGELSFRGYRASPTLGAAQGLAVFLDGVRINEAFGDVVNWDLVPEAALGDVQLAAGSNPLYGQNTLGGALNLRTRSGLDQQGLAAELSGGGDARRRADLSYGWRNDAGWHAFVAGTGHADDGWRDHSASRLGNVFAKAGRRGARDDVSLSFLHGRSRLLGNGLLPSWRLEDGARDNGLYEADRRAVYTYPDRNENRLTQLTLHGEHRYSDVLHLTGLAYLRRGTRDTVNGDVGEDYEEYVEQCEDGFAADGSPLDDGCPYTRAEGAAVPSGALNTTHATQRRGGAALNLAGRLSQHRWLLGTGVDLSKVDYAQYEQDGTIGADRGVRALDGSERAFFSGVSGDTHAVGVYGSDTWSPWSRTHLTVSLRWDHSTVANRIETDDGAQPRERFRYVQINPAIGLAQSLDNGIKLFGGWSQNSRTPTAIELGCADPAQPCRLPTGLQADPYLDQVVSRTIELGARWQSRENWRASLALYRTDNRDDILFLRAANTQQGYFANVPHTRHQGADLSLRGTLGPLALRVGYSWLDARYEAATTLAAGERDVAVRSGTRIAALPEHSARLGLDWTLRENLGFGADLLAFSSQRSSGNEDGRIDNEDDTRHDWRTAGYALVDLRAHWQPHPAVELYTRIDNLFDRRYETFGAVADDLFPNGELLQPHIAAGDAAPARFVAPGAPRTWVLGLRYRYGA